ncbi:MAG: electron transfer flavoprotein subunit beta/FixA family protein [Chloroflexota bacterium]
MNIVVCVKQVPDTAARVVVEDGRVNWGEAELVLNPWDEYAVEAALRVSEEHGGPVTAISIGGGEAKEALKPALAMGCSQAILISDPALKTLDSLATAKVLAAAIKKVGGVDLAFFGRQAVDADNGVTASQVARILGWSALTLVSVISSLDEQGRSIRVERSIEEGRQVTEGHLPAVLSMVKDFGEPRYPSFMGIRKASKAEIPVWTVGDLGIEPPTSTVSWSEVMNPPTREVTCEIITGDSLEAMAESLAGKIIAEKVL